MTLKFTTKADTLSALQYVLKSARIAPLEVFTVADWHANRNACVTNVVEKMGGVSLIVRSSCAREDGVASSNAGVFLSIPNVDAVGLEAAVTRVIESYGLALPTDQVLIQPMLNGVIRSGVAFSHDPNTLSLIHI